MAKPSSKSAASGPRRWVVTLEAIDGSDDLLLPLPVELLAQMGWAVGDDLCCVASESEPGCLILRRVTADDDKGGTG